MKRTKLLALILISFIVFLLSGCEFIEMISDVTTTINQITTVENENTTTKSSGDSTTEDVINTQTTENTTIIVDPIVMDNYYKLGQAPSVNYYSISKEDEYLEWRFLKSTGTQKILVVPVYVTEYMSEISWTTIKADIEETMFGDPKDGKLYWESLSSFYNKSSFGKLTITGTVLNQPMGPYTISQLSSTEDTGAEDICIENLDSYLSNQGIQKTDYDQDKDGCLDLVMFIYLAPNASNDEDLSDDDFWAYCYSTGYIGSKSNPKINNYLWASYDFMYEADGGTKGNNGLDAHTYIHESGHALGLDDYYIYDNNSNYSCTGENIMMAYNICDHDAFSKFALGWTAPYVVMGNCEISLSPSESNGDSIILYAGTKFDDNAFAEYLIFEYYTPTGLNKNDVDNTYSGGIPGNSGSGIRVWHVDARLAYTKNPNANNPTFNLVQTYSDFKSSLGTGLVVGYSNSRDYSNVTQSKSNPQRLISLVDASTGTDYYKKSSFYAQQSQLYTASKTLDTSKIKWHSSTYPKYNVTFTYNASEDVYIVHFTQK